MLALAAVLAGQRDVAAYDVCTDDYADRGVFSCAHEQMFDEALRFVVQGLIELPRYENIDKLLWLFLNVSQLARYFASDDSDGDAFLNSDPRCPYADVYAADARNEVMLACAVDGHCPTDADDLQDNDKNTYPYYDNDDSDLDRIRKYSYVP